VIQDVSEKATGMLANNLIYNLSAVASMETTIAFTLETATQEMVF